MSFFRSKLIFVSSILLISIFPNSFANTPNSRYIHGYLQCSNSVFCPKNFRPYQQISDNHYKQLRESAQKIVKLLKEGVIGVHKSSKFINLVDIHRLLCLDDTLGFLLDEHVENYTVTCVWTGISQFGQCQPVPHEYLNRTFSYIKPFEWGKKLYNIRNQLNCIDKSYQQAKFELYICNDRCVQAGIGYFASMLMIIVLTTSIFLNIAG